MTQKTFMPIALTAIVMAVVALFGFSHIAQAAGGVALNDVGAVRTNSDVILAAGPHEAEDELLFVNGVGLNDAVAESNPVVATNNASQVGATTAQLNGYFDTGALLTTLVVHFEYGTSKSNLTYGTTPQTMEFFVDSGTHARSIAGLEKDTKYYYRMVGRYDGRTIYGDTKSFTTTDGVVTTTTVVSNTSSNNSSSNTTSNSNSSNTGSVSTNTNSNTDTTASSAGSISSTATTTYARLSITDNETRIERGDEVTYTVTYEARQSLKDAELHVELPDGMTVLRSSRGTVDKGDSAVVIDLGDLSTGSKRTIEIDARMSGSARDGKDLRATAELSFETSNGSARSVTATDTTEFVGGASGLGASIFGTGIGLSFFNWLLIAGIIAIIIILARKQFQKG